MKICVSASRLLSAGLFVSCLSATSAFAQTGTTRIAPWKDDKKSAFMLEFDDSIPTDFQNVVPELQKRNLTATFYINPGNYAYTKNVTQWEEVLPPIPGVVYGNHTMKHDGLKDYDSADADLKQVDAIILRLFPGKQPRLISFAKPGVSKDKWTITDDDYKKVLAANHLIAREEPGLNAAQFNNLKTPEAMLAIVDDGIAKGKSRAILFHGVGGDWISTPTEVVTALMDGLVQRSDKVWVTDHISAHKYATEVKTAKVNVLDAPPKKIRLELKSEADTQFYDGPLTLVTEVPADWKKVQIVQGQSKATAVATDGHVQFQAVPGEDSIALTPVP